MARRRGLERTRVSLNEVVGSVTDLFAYDARMHEIALVPGLAVDLPAVHADRSALQQVLVNLVQNAIQALRGRGKPSRLEIRTRADRAHVYVEVADDGPGVRPPRAARGSSTPSSRRRAPTRARASGSPSAARSPASTAATSCSRTGRRTRARSSRCASPLEVRPPSSAEAPGRAIPEGVPARVLVVDDEAPVRDSLVQTLHRMGAQVDGIGVPAEAEHHLDGDTAYDAILLDVRMPGRTGLEVHRALALKHPELARRVVFMTGDLVNDDVLKAVRATGSPLLEKPFSADELRAALAELTPS